MRRGVQRPGSIYRIRIGPPAVSAELPSRAKGAARVWYAKNWAAGREAMVAATAVGRSWGRCLAVGGGGGGAISAKVPDGCVIRSYAFGGLGAMGFGPGPSGAAQMGVFGEAAFFASKTLLREVWRYDSLASATWRPKARWSCWGIRTAVWRVRWW